MELKQNLNLKLSNRLILTPSLKHQLSLLLLPKLELEQTIRQELEENPFLEEIASIETDIEPIKDLSKYYDEEEENYLSNKIVYKPTLLDLLSFQIDLEFDDDEKPIAYEIVGDLNNKGFLEVPIEEIAEKLKVPVEKVEKVRKKLRHLEPTGIASKDLKESLLVQYEEKFGKDDVVERIIKEDLGKINDINYLKNKYTELSEDEIRYIISNIKSLNPYPTFNFETETTKYIEPDIYIYDKGDSFEIVVNERDIPRLNLTNQYKKLINKKDLPEDTKKFLEDKLQKAVGIIRGIQQRRENLYSITESLVKHQEDFLRKGKKYLKPLTMREIAREVGLHESTVSRIVSSKFAQTPIGVIPLKSFFAGKLTTSGGGEISTENVKSLIEEIIKNEDKSKPLSDSAISKILKEKGINIARRTVAKYREQLNIPDSRLRRIRT